MKIKIILLMAIAVLLLAGQPAATVLALRTAQPLQPPPAGVSPNLGGNVDYQSQPGASTGQQAGSAEEPGPGADSPASNQNAPGSPVQQSAASSPRQTRFGTALILAILFALVLGITWWGMFGANRASKK